ncbi:MAG: hypothetical protein JNL70_06225 [Saprospiraceae bacterium]|nr:hypothetical protein [Saprospiraceae bacterium]
MGFIFLRHAYNRFVAVKNMVEQQLPVHPQGNRRPLSIKKSLFLRRY